MQQLEFDLLISNQLSHLEWQATFTLIEDEWIYNLLAPSGKHYADCYTGTNSLKLAF